MALIGAWSCNQCSTVEGVQNGICPKCGPTQTTPQDDSAKILAGVKENKAVVEEEKEPEADSTHK